MMCGLEIKPGTNQRKPQEICLSWLIWSHYSLPSLYIDIPWLISWFFFKKKHALMSHSILYMYIYIYTWVVDKITYYSQWTWPKRVVPYRLWRFSHKFKHPKSTPYYLSLPRILPLTHIYWNHQIPGCYVARDSAWRASWNSSLRPDLDSLWGCH